MWFRFLYKYTHLLIHAQCAVVKKALKLLDYTKRKLANRVLLYCLKITYTHINLHPYLHHITVTLDMKIKGNCRRPQNSPQLLCTVSSPTGVEECWALGWLMMKQCGQGYTAGNKYIGERRWNNYTRGKRQATSIKVTHDETMWSGFHGSWWNNVVRGTRQTPIK